MSLDAIDLSDAQRQGLRAANDCKELKRRIQLLGNDTSIPLVRELYDHLREAQFEVAICLGLIKDVLEGNE